MLSEKLVKKLKTFDLSGCELYTIGKPCAMCVCASMWADIKKIYYGASVEDNAKIGFRDDKMDKTFVINLENEDEFFNQINREECLKLFDRYNAIIDRIIY